MTFNPVPINVPNFAGTSTPLISYNDGTNNAVAHVLLDNTGALIAPATSGNQATGNASLATIATAASASSTAALQTAGNTLLTEIEASLAGTLAVSGTVAVSGSALPTGAATSALQSTGNTSLAAIVTDVAPVPGVIALTVGTPGTAGRAFVVNCTVAGNVSVTFSDTSTSIYPVSVGLTVFPFQVTEVNSSGTTATATYQNWK